MSAAVEEHGLEAVRSAARRWPFLATLIAAGGDEFGPEDRPMREYASVPRSWLSVDDPNLAEWLSIAHDHVGQMPPKP